LTELVYELRGAGLSAQRGPILRNLDWCVEDRAVSVLYGAGGAGKTSLLRALARTCGPGVTPHGTWLFRGAPLFDESRSRPVEGLAWCAQPPRDWKRQPGVWGPGLTRALGRADPSRVLLLDEPNAWVTAEDYPQLVERILKLKRSMPVVLSTHHVEFGRSCADHVCLLGDARILESQRADVFFRSTSTYVRQLLRSGAAWPTAPEAPKGFNWVLHGALAGMPKPGLMGATAEDLDFLVSVGVTTLVSLTEDPFDPRLTTDHGLNNAIHFPIRDMGVPGLAKAAGFAQRVADMIARGEVVAFHCKGGLGRTGLMMAIVLMARGQPADRAIATVREVQPMYIQTAGQLGFICAMEQYFNVHDDATDTPGYD